MPIALLATGDELVVGDTLNTNGQQDEGEQTHQHIDAVFAKGKLNF